jgi:hypothetical protein
MGILGASRFTALLAAVAISGMAGTFWWALETRSEMKAATGNRGSIRAVPSKFPGRATKAKDEPPAKLEAGKFELMGKSDRPQLSNATIGAADRSDDQEPAPILANYPSPPPVPAPNSGFQTRGLQIPSLPIPDAQSQISQGSNRQSSVSPGATADMPLPALPPPTRPDPTPSWQTKFPDPQFLVHALPVAPQPAETQKRQMRGAVTAAAAPARAPKPQAQSYYMEKYLDQGEYRYRRRLCEPPNMPDVCFMPQADRQPILAAKP